MRRWIERHPRGAPDPTGDHWRYFKAGMRRRKWVQIITAVASTLAACVAAVASVIWISNGQCEELRSRAREAQTLEPVQAIQSILPLSAFSFCRAPDAWLEVLETLGQSIQGQRLRAAVTLPDAPAHFVDFLPGSGHVVTIAADGSGAVFDPVTGEPIEGELSMPAADVAPMVLYDQGRFLLIRDRRVTVWNPRRGEVVGLPYQGEGRVLSAALSPEGDTLVVATEGNRLHFHSLASGRELREAISGLVNAEVHSDLSRFDRDLHVEAHFPDPAKIFLIVSDDIVSFVEPIEVLTQKRRRGRDSFLLKDEGLTDCGVERLSRHEALRRLSNEAVPREALGQERVLGCPEE